MMCVEGFNLVEYLLAKRGGGGGGDVDIRTITVESDMTMTDLDLDYAIDVDDMPKLVMIWLDSATAPIKAGVVGAFIVRNNPDSYTRFAYRYVSGTALNGHQASSFAKEQLTVKSNDNLYIKDGQLVWGYENDGAVINAGKYNLIVVK